MNDLRRELKTVRGRLQDFEVAQQTFDERGVHSIDALIQTLNADAGYSLSLVKQFDCFLLKS